MAIFQDTRDLDRQERYVGMNKSGNKIGLALMGYKDTGERNKFGQIMSVINPLAPAARITAGKGDRIYAFCIAPPSRL